MKLQILFLMLLNYLSTFKNKLISKFSARISYKIAANTKVKLIPGGSLIYKQGVLIFH